LFCKINPYHQGKIVLTQAEFNLFFEGADLEKRFVDSPTEIRKKGLSANGVSKSFLRKRAEKPLQLASI